MNKPLSRPIQMADIAQLAGVSKSTVSRALANSPLVNQHTKDLVMKIAREHNYRPNLTARNFRLKETLTIAVILVGEKDSDWRFSDPFFLELLGSIAEAIDAHGHHLLLTKTSPQSMTWINDFITQRQSDGVILVGQSTQHKEIDLMAKNYRGISVWGAQVNESYSYPVVGSNNKLGGYRATQHLIDTGRKNILFLGYKEVPEIMQRYQGYCEALKQAGVSVKKNNIRALNGTHNVASLQNEFSKMKKNKIDFDAVFAVSDMIAISAIHALQSMKLTIPEDVSVVGYDDIPISSHYNPPLSTIHQNRSIGAKILVDNLLEVLDGHKPEIITLDPQLIVRASS